MIFDVKTLCEFVELCSVDLHGVSSRRLMYHVVLDGPHDVTDERFNASDDDDER